MKRRFLILVFVCGYTNFSFGQSDTDEGKPQDVEVIRLYEYNKPIEKPQRTPAEATAAQPVPPLPQSVPKEDPSEIDGPEDGLGQGNFIKVK